MTSASDQLGPSEPSSAIDRANTRPPSLLRRMVRKALEIGLARTPIGRILRRVPGLERGYMKLVMRRRDHTGLHAGVFSTYAAAFAAIPKHRLGGWDHDVTAMLWVDTTGSVRPSTYPILFWLDKLLTPNAQLIDLGGSIGITYYGYRRYSKLPDGARWTIVEVPAIVEQGRKIAQREKAAGLELTDRLENLASCDILLTAGALQYMEHSVPGLLARLPQLPRYILINKIPLTSGPGFWTLQNYGPAVSPDQIYNEQAFIAYFEQAGYQVRDRWAVQDLDCAIPFHPERYIREFAGLLFERRT